MNKITTLIISAFVSIGSLVGVVVVTQGTVSAQTPTPAAQSASEKAVCEGIAMTGGACNNNDNAINGVVTQVVNILSTLVGIVSVIMIIVGGFKYVTSSGDSNKVSSAKNTIVYALVGLVIVALAQFIVNFVLNKI